MGTISEEHHHHDHDHVEHASASESSSTFNAVVVAKLTAMLVLFTASLIAGLIPTRLSRWFKWTPGDARADVRVSILLAIGGGVLLCTTFMHLLPEVSEAIAELQEHGTLPNYKFHLPELLMCVGFFVIFLVEELVHVYLHSREKKQASKIDVAFRRSLSVRRSGCGLPQQPPSTTQSTCELVKAETGHSGHSHAVADPVVAGIRGLLVVLALSVHELFEGLAVGLESSAANVWYMFGAVAAHKLVIAFCVGVELAVSEIRPALALLYVFFFAVVSPLGIGAGVALSAGGEEGALASGVASVVLQGLATGTLLYVVFFEVLQTEGRHGLASYVAMLAGFFVMFGLTFLTGHEHNHGHDHDHGVTSP